MSRENSNIILQFVRHGDHDISDKSRANKDLPLLDESKKNVLNRTSFLGDNYWSADIPGRSKDYACFVTFFESTDSCDEKKYTDYYVRCVR